MSRIASPPRQGAKPGKPSIPDFAMPAMPPIGLFTWMGRTGRTYLRRYRAEQLLREQPQLLDDLGHTAEALKAGNAKQQVRR